mmetsp:Transcript_34793/g.62037  ORF Transcript_34793/g.62037 Transcript_34793/m.62037 type:complete len:84 (+) Transcript_34793:105-356(+)
MFGQGDVEREAGGQPSFMMDRNLPGVCHGANQVGFFDFIVIPLLTAWTDTFPESVDLLEQAMANYNFWRQQKESEKAVVAAVP